MDKHSVTKRLEKIFKNKNNLYICVIFIIGAVLMLTSGGITKKNHRQQAPNTLYDEEERLEAIISDIKGAGRVTVMITYYAGEGKELAYETRTNRSERSSDMTESVDTQAVITSGEPVVLRNTAPEVKGVIVTAEGAGDAAVRADIREAVCAALGVGAHRVCVYEKK